MLPERQFCEGWGLGEADVKVAVWGKQVCVLGPESPGVRFLGGPVLQLPDRGKDPAQNQKQADWARVEAVPAALGMQRIRLKVGRGQFQVINVD